MDLQALLFMTVVWFRGSLERGFSVWEMGMIKYNGRPFILLHQAGSWIWDTAEILGKHDDFLGLPVTEK